MKIWSFIIAFIVLTIGLLGCSQNEEASEDETIHIPEEIPADFGFSLQFGVQKNNVVNTFEGTVTKDLIADGTASTELTLSEEELRNIYKKMQEIKIAEAKEFIPQPRFGSVCVQEPYEEDEWEIVINGETITHEISGTYCDPTDDAREMIELRRYVWEIVKNKAEYQVLPEANGAYE